MLSRVCICGVKSNLPSPRHAIRKGRTGRLQWTNPRTLSGAVPCSQAILVDPQRCSFLYATAMAVFTRSIAVRGIRDCDMLA